MSTPSLSEEVEAAPKKRRGRPVTTGLRAAREAPPRTGASDPFQRRFRLLVTLPGEEPQLVDRYRTRAEAEAAFDEWVELGARGLVESVTGPKVSVSLPLTAEEIAMRATPNSKRYPQKSTKRTKPLRAKGVRQQETGDRIMVMAWGEEKTLHEWSRDPRAKVPYVTIRNRLMRKTPWPPERAIAEAGTDNAVRALNKERAPKYEAFGESRTVNEWLMDPRCECAGRLLRERLKNGMPLELALQRRTHSDWRKNDKDVEGHGESKPVSEWAKDPRCKVSQTVLSAALKRGVAIEDALAGITSVKRVRYRAFGEAKTLAEWARDPRCVVAYRTLDTRLKSGVPIEVAICREDLRPERTGPSADPAKQSPEAARLLAAIQAARAELGAKPTAFGESKSLSKWVADPRCHVERATLNRRLQAGVPFETALGPLVSVRASQSGTAFGVTRTYDEWADVRECKVGRQDLFVRLRAGMALEAAMTKPAAQAPIASRLAFVESMASALADLMEARSARAARTAMEMVRGMVELGEEG